MKSFGMLIDWISSQYHQEIWRGVHAYCKDQGINLFTFVTRNAESPTHWDKKRNQLLELVQNGQFDGFLFNTTTLGIDSDHEQLRQILARVSPSPVVSIGNDLQGTFAVMVDNRQGFRRLLDHLYEVHGYRKFAYAGGPQITIDGRDRKEQFLDFLREKGLPVRGDRILDGDFSSRWGKEAVERMVPGEKPDFEVLVCADDEIARGAHGALVQRDFLVPGDVALTGFDDLPSAAVDALTTTRQPLFEIGWTASSLLGGLVDGKDSPRVIRVPTFPVLRQSCGCQSPAARITDEVGHESLPVSFSEAIKTGKTQLAVEMVGDGLPEALITPLLASFLESWETQLPGPFHRHLKHVLPKMMEKDLNPAHLHFALSVLRLWVFRAAEPEQRKIFAENLIHHARIILTEALHSQVDQAETRRFIQLTVFSELNEGLVFSRDFSDQAAIILESLPKLGVKKFQMTLYGDPAQPLKTAKLVLTDQGEVPGGGVQYDPKALFGPGFEPGTEPWTYVAEALFDRNASLGFLLLDAQGDVDRLKVFDQLGERISPGIETIHRIQQLEDQVALRTSELKDALEDLEAYNVQLKEMALRDEMTGLYNRRGFLTLAEHQLKSNYRRSQDLTLFFGDLDGLKMINDTWGHDAGDEAIRTTARLLVETFRSDDIVARLGGDEFVVLAPGCSPTDAKVLAARLEQSLLGWEEGKYGISLGWIAIDTKAKKSLADWMKEADETLYRAKEINRSKKAD